MGKRPKVKKNKMGLIKIIQRIPQLSRLIFKPKLLVLITVALFLADYILFKLLGDNYEEKSVLLFAIFAVFEIYITVGTTGLLVSWVKKKKVYKPIVLLLVLTIITFLISYKVNDFNSRILSNLIAFIVFVLFFSTMVLIVSKVAKPFNLKEFKQSFKQMFSKQNIIKNKKLIGFSLVLVLILALTIPSFVYNELEFHFRLHYAQAEYVFEQADNLISLRKSDKDPVANEKEYTQWAKEIEKGMDLVINEEEEAQKINTLQDYVPLLPSKYRTYQKQKKVAIEKYLVYLKGFKVKDQNDHMLSDVTLKLTKNGELFGSAAAKGDYWQKLEVGQADATAVSLQAQQLYLNGFITKDLYDYFTKGVDVMTFIYNESQKVKSTGSWSSFNTEGLNALSSAETVDVYKLYDESNKIGSSIQRKLNKEYDEAYKLIEKTSKYYDDNNLAWDTLSKIISKFNNRFPRNHTQNQNNLFLPPNVDPNLVSMLVSPGYNTLLSC